MEEKLPKKKDSYARFGSRVHINLVTCNAVVNTNKEKEVSIYPHFLATNI